MPSLFLSLVEQLAVRHDGGRRHNAALDAEEQASRLFLIACDLMGAFQPADLRTHLEGMMTKEWPAALHTEAATRGRSGATAAAAPVTATATAAAADSSVPTLVAASGALLGYMWTLTSSDAEPVAPTATSTAAAAAHTEYVLDMHARWQSNVLQLLSAHPPFSAEARTTVCYTVGQLSLLPCHRSSSSSSIGCCERVLRAACDALQAGSEDGLTAVMATELLGQCTSLMVVCAPFQLRGAVLEDPAVAHKQQQNQRLALEKSKKTKKAGPSSTTPAGAAGQSDRRSKPSTQRATTATSGSGVAAAEAGDVCTAIPSCYPFPTASRVAQLTAELIECCLSALGASADSSPAAATTNTGASWASGAAQHRTVPTSLICQRVLIPLLLLGGSEGLERYEALVHNLLHTLAYRSDATAAAAASVGATTAKARADAVASHDDDGLDDSLVNTECCDDVVLLIAALFDFLFRRPSLDPATDFRFSGFLWTVLRGALHRSLTAAGVDAGHRANMQLRVEYLLKRIVYLTKEQQYQQALAVVPPGGEPSAPTVVDFHPLFRWCCGAGSSSASAESPSAVAWDSFFLVLESLNEYGWHIIEPVMPRLDTLIRDLDDDLRRRMDGNGAAAAAAGPSPAGGALHTQWIEALLLKLILHPNIGVRKVGLRRVWGLPTRVLQSLSASFVFQYTFQSASDPRLCADLDRLPITASFLDTKAFEGSEVKAVPDIEPLAQEVERFYSHVFLTRWPAAEADGTGSTESRGAAGRIDALHRLLDTTLSKPPRFTVCVLARTLLAMGNVALEHGIDMEPILLDDGVLQRLHRFMRDSVQENIPFWLDVRVTAILFAALTTFVAASASPRRCRLHPSFWRLYCMCGPLGESGGHSITGMDACGQYGAVGASIDELFLQQWLAQLQLQHTGSLITQLLDVEGLEGRVRGLLSAPSSSSSSSACVVDVVAVKETFFLMGTLRRTASASDAQHVDAAGHAIAAAVSALQSRAYCAPAQLLSSAACLVEFYRTAGAAACQQLWPLHTTLQSMAAALHTHAMAALEAAVQALAGATTQGGDALCGGEEADEAQRTWTLMHTTHFDVLAAAVASLNAIAAPTPGAADVLGTAAVLERLMALLGELSALYHNAASWGEDRVAGLLIVTRNTYRLLQSELCGFLTFQRDPASDKEDCRNDDATAAGFDLPSQREPAVMAASLRCPLALQLPSRTVQAYLTQLIALPAYRVPTNTVPSALSDMPWSTVLGQHGRYRCNILYVFALCLQPAASDAASAHDTRAERDSAMVVTSADDWEKMVAAMQDFALGQLEECWTTNLASVYDLLLWVASSNMPHIVDYTAIADAMWEHMREVGARQYTRLAALSFTVLHYVMPHHPTYVRDVLLRVLEGEGKEAQTADRDVYFAAMTASLQVLHTPAAHWPVLREVLLYAAVLFNTNRDEEENESTVAVTEPLLWSWPAALRLYYPPTTRMSAVGRAMAVSTLLWCCTEDVAGRAVPTTVELLRMNVCHPVVTHEPCMPNSRTHRTRIRLWQLLCALLPSLAQQQQQQQSVSSAQLEEIFRLLVFHCLTVNNMGSVRRLMELYAIRLVEQHPALYTTVSEALGNYSLRPQVCGSYILIACHALLKQEEEKDGDDGTTEDSCKEEGAVVNSARAVDDARSIAVGTFESLFPRILQQSTSNQHLLRIISHIGLVNICQRRLAHGKPLPPAVAAVYDYVLHAPEHIKFREKHMDMLFFDTDAASNPRSLFCVQRKEANTVLAEVLPAAAFERIRFVETEMCCMIGALYPMELLRVRDWCASLRVQSLVSVFKDFAAIPHTDSPCDYYVDYTQEATELLTRDPMLEAGAGAAAEAATANVQKKVSSWWTSEVYNELHPRALRTRKQSIIVVGSLLENPVNIAGLCRCGEIFAVESIVVPEKKVFEHPHFVAAARSAELWIPWEEVMPKDLPGYLEGLRRRGYTIVGIEQTANSVSMEAFAFPERCAVVLGAEGQGVPAPLIPLLDVCVEIPQYGLIRSLNVHVTGAIAMYEYTRQHLMGKTQA